MKIEFLNKNEINALLGAIDDVRDRAIVTLFLNSGLFLNELAGLKINNLDWKTRILAIPGSRKREILLNDQAFEALAKWSQERPGKKTNHLFVTTKGAVKDLSARMIDHLTRKYAEQAGIKKKVNAQILRNTFAVRLFSEDISVDKASAILGISDSESINRYIQAAKNKLDVSNESRSEAMAKLDTRPFLSRTIAKIFPTKPTPAKPVTDIMGPIVPTPEEVIFGRESMVEDIKSNLSKKQPVLLIGPLGIGKTHLLKHMTRANGPNTLYIASPSPIKNMLSLICDKLDPDWRKQVISRASTKDIVDFIVRNRGFQPQVPILIIDNLQNLKISDVDVMIALLENFTILGATEELTPKLKQIWWKFKQIEVKSLSDKSSKEIIKYLTQNLSISDYEMLETRIMSLSDRLPLAIVDMVHQISHSHVVTKDVIRDVYHEAGVHYRDWSYAIVVLWGLMISFRFVALGSHSFEGYILAGFGTAFLMVLRFFMFKMR
jgi:energy-coupling factor transporter ATP-binding protein EcfA2